ncbi:MAG: tRNA pseudouridine32 synthase/23S rRNA pseudouridine746 synthase [Lentisphaeria bacterium]|jgi:tRNA pseudouridine32 synthase/23S rRNA pseudouridine746 synthase
MGIAKTPSKLTLPELHPGIGTVLEYMVKQFSAISPESWRQRMIDGKVHWHDGRLIYIDTPYQAKQRVYYYREVDNEVEIPFKETIVFQDAHILVAQKPHFLPVTPGGQYVDQCLQARLRETTGLTNLQALHRLDRVTAGLVIFSINPETRALYHHLFEHRKIHKTYHAIVRINENQNVEGKSWELKNRIEKKALGFLMQITAGPSNSHSKIRCLQQKGDKALFELNPITGKTHQLRLHMRALGWPILNDKYYPKLQPETADDYTKPLQLLAKSLTFIDPVTQQSRVFNSDRGLTLE